VHRSAEPLFVSSNCHTVLSPCRNLLCEHYVSKCQWTMLQWVSTFLDTMDKDSRDDFTFAKLCDIKLPVTFRMYGGYLIWAYVTHWGTDLSSRVSENCVRLPKSWTTQNSSFVVCNHRLPLLCSSEFSSEWTARSLSDLYVTCQLIADNKPLTIPFRTSFKAFKNSYT